MNKRTTVSTRSLVLHPALERVTLMPEVIARLRKQKVKKPEHHEKIKELELEWSAFLASLEDEGILDPLKVIIGTSTVADGRNRLMGAMELKMPEVPIQYVTEEEAHRIIEATVIGRRHMSKGAKAYFAVVMHPEVAASKVGRPANSDSVGITRSSLADKFGVSSDLIDQACKLYMAFEDSKTLREAHEKLIWAGFGLGGILAGVAGAAHTGGKGISTSNYATGFVRRFATLGGAVAEKWEKITNEDDRMTIADGVHTMIMKLPPELRQLTLSKMEEEV
jgi:hypothetical protein